MKAWYVKDTAFSQRVSPDDMAVFQRVCPEKRYSRGSVIFYAGDPASSLHVVAAGQVKLVTPTATGNERILALLGPNDIFGEAFLSKHAHYRVDAIALTDTVTCPVSREQFMQMANEAASFVLTFTEIITQNLFDCRDQLSTSYAPVKSRIIRVLLEQAERFGQAQEGGWVELKTQLKHEELASMVSATRVSVSMAIAELRDEGLLEGTRGQYQLLVEPLADMLDR